MADANPTARKAPLIGYFVWLIFVLVVLSIAAVVGPRMWQGAAFPDQSAGLRGVPTDAHGGAGHAGTAGGLPERIDLDNAEQVRRLAAQLGVTPERLRLAARDVAPRLEDVVQRLKEGQ